MGVPDEARISMCQGKQRFGSFGEAGHALSRPGFGRTRSHRVERYRCDYCGGWHVGGAAMVVRQKRRQRLEELREQDEETDGPAEDG